MVRTAGEVKKIDPVSARHGASTLWNQKAAHKGRLSACRGGDTTCGTGFSLFSFPPSRATRRAWSGTLCSFILPIARSAGGGHFGSLSAMKPHDRVCPHGLVSSFLSLVVSPLDAVACGSHLLQSTFSTNLQTRAKAAATKSHEKQEENVDDDNNHFTDCHWPRTGGGALLLGQAADCRFL